MCKAMCKARMPGLSWNRRKWKADLLCCEHAVVSWTLADTLCTVVPPKVHMCCVRRWQRMRAWAWTWKNT